MIGFGARMRSRIITSKGIRDPRVSMEHVPCTCNTTLQSGLNTGCHRQRSCVDKQVVTANIF